MLAVTWDQKKHAQLISKHPYMMSTKMDGVRARWDGRRLTTRGGHTIHAPATFTRRIPPTPLEGELYIGRGRFQEVSGLVRRLRPQSNDWDNVRFMVFDDPSSHLPFLDTYRALRRMLPSCSGRASVCVIPQTPVSDVGQVREALHRELGRGGEGVMLRRADTPHKLGRATTLLKVKGQQDAEAVVVGYDAGKGRLADTIGALRCVWVKDKRVRFQVGSGLTDDMRRRHARLFPVGTVITVEFMSLDPTSGRPRHPRFKGVRHDL